MLQDNIIRIEGEAALAFLDAAWHPNPDALRRRDEMFAQWEAEFAEFGCHDEDDDIVLEIPDIDFAPKPSKIPAVSRTESDFPPSAMPYSALDGAALTDIHAVSWADCDSFMPYSYSSLELPIAA